MYLIRIWITGYLPDDHDDPFIKYELDVPPRFNEQLLELSGHATISELAMGMWPLTKDQILQIGEVLQQPFPVGLDFFISVVRE